MKNLKLKIYYFLLKKLNTLSTLTSEDYPNFYRNNQKNRDLLKYGLPRSSIPLNFRKKIIHKSRNFLINQIYILDKEDIDTVLVNTIKVKNKDRTIKVQYKKTKLEKLRNYGK